MTDTLQRQSDNILPAFGGRVLPIALNTSAVTYDLASIDFGSAGSLVRDGQEAGEMFVRLICNGDFYYLFSNDSTVAVSKTAAVAAGGTPAFTANAGDLVPANFPEHVRINRRKHRYLSVMADSGTPILRLRQASPMTGSVKEI